MANMLYPQVGFKDVSIGSHCLVGKRREVVLAHTLRHQLQMLKSTGRYDAFRLKWHPAYDEAPSVPPIPNHLFWDSDVAKWIEGTCYFLQQCPMPEFDSAIEELVEMITQAQQPDGYLNIHYTVVEPGKRFTNLKDMHELYNAGHLIEAALAHESLYGNQKLLNVMLRYVNLINLTFGPSDNQIHGYPGHSEIELSLLRLYDHTGNPKHLSLARYFLLERGNAAGMDGRHFYDWEIDQRGEDPSFQPAFYPEPRSYWYHQAHDFVVSQQTIEGHSVRAMYLFTAYTDLIRIDSKSTGRDHHDSMLRLWDNMVQRKMYVTGGIGAVRKWEGFGKDFFLPQSLDEGGCYAETCAAIGIMMWAQRLLMIDLDGRFADVMELCLYNSVLTAMSLSGDAFTYHNQLASSDEDLDKRSEWFTVACCPPNLMRLLGQIGGYVWTSHDFDAASPTIAVHLFVSSTIRLSGAYEGTTISQTTRWPWSESITFAIDGPHSVDLKIRIPGWAQSYTIQPRCTGALLGKGYLTVPAQWLATCRKFTIKIPTPPRWVSPSIESGRETVTLVRGPIIYCAEDFDNDWVIDHFKTVMLNTQAPVQEYTGSEDINQETWIGLVLQNGCYVLSSSCASALPFVDVHVRQNNLQEISKFYFVPYGLRSNRGGRGHMRVGFAKSPC